MTGRSVLVLAFLTLSAVPAAAQTDACTLVTASSSQNITAFSTCKNVTNNAANTVCAITGVDSTQWASFYNNPPSGVTIGSCGPTCTGGYIDAQNFCWRASGSGASCDSACTSAGYTCHAERTRTWAGSSGTNATCQDIMDGLGLPGTTVSTLSSTVGCAVTGTTRRRGTSTTTCAATLTGYYRACACNSPGSSCIIDSTVLQSGNCVTAYSGSSFDNCGGACTTCAANSATVCCTDGVLSDTGYPHLYCNDECSGSLCF